MLDMDQQRRRRPSYRSSWRLGAGRPSGRCCRPTGEIATLITPPTTADNRPRRQRRPSTRRRRAVRTRPGGLASPGAMNWACSGRRAAIALRLFFDAVAGHHADEEDELFPAVLRGAAKGEEALRVQAMVTRLTADHRRIDALWKALEPAVRAVANHRPAELDLVAVEALVQAYLAHARMRKSSSFRWPKRSWAATTNAWRPWACRFTSGMHPWCRRRGGRFRAGLLSPAVAAPAAPPRGSPRAARRP